MRLTELQIQSINALSKKHFGSETTVYLFGSRTDDLKRGGDIDLLIRNKNEQVLTLDAKIYFLAELKKKIGNQKIDVVFDNMNTRKKQNFYRSITLNQVKLS
jgi:predicted nucleotidyltransferase